MSERTPEVRMGISSRAVFQRNFLIALGIALSLFFLRYYQFVNFRELDAVDLRILLRGEQKAHPDLVLVEIDDASLTALGGWPWPRKYHAEMLEILSRQNADLIFYDVLFPEPDPDSKVDDRIAKTMEKSANVILPFFYYPEQSLEAFYPIKLFRESARAIGFMNGLPDADGHVRKVQARFYSNNLEYHHTALLSVLARMRDEESARTWLKKIPLSSEGNLWINFPGPAAVYKRISFLNVVEMDRQNKRAELREIFEDKVVLVGQVFRGVQHARPTLYSPDTPGLVIQAGAMHTLLNGKFIRESGALTGLLIMLVLNFWTAFIASTLPGRKAIVWVLMSIGAYSLFNFGLFYSLGILVPSFMPVTAMVLTFIALLLYSNSDMRFQNELMRRELAMAAKIQGTFLPEMRPSIPGFDMAFKCHFAEHIGGDFYDWADFGGGRIAFSVGDVSGKGIPAAIYMVCAISEFRRENKPGRNPAKTLKALNLQLATQAYSGMFLTMTSVVVDRHDKTLHISSAGHEPFFYFHGSSKKVETLDPPKGPPLGLFTDAQYEDTVMKYEEGDVLVLISDGVKESRNLKGVGMGTQAIQSYLQEQAFFLSAEELLKGIFDLMERHLQGTSAHDDRTVFCVKLGQRF